VYNDNLVGLLTATSGNVVYDRILFFGEDVNRIQNVERQVIGFGID
jgi:hypothetical protein